jgi:hypothetical protein
MRAKVFATLSSGNNTYEYFEYLGRFPAQLEPSQVEYELGKSIAHAYCDPSELELFKLTAGDFVISKSTRETLDISVRKMDRRPIYAFRDCPFFDKAVNVLQTMFEDALEQPVLSHDEVLATMDMTKAVGFVETRCGYRAKRTYFDHGHASELLEPELLEETPVWKVSGKVEKLTRKEYVLDQKQRTFIIEPVELLYHHKRIFGGQNAGMKMHGWSYYGFNPFNGGVGELAEKLSRHKRKFMFDGKSWDRVASWMGEIWKVRTRLAPDDPFKNWVVYHVVNSCLVLPNGDFVRKTWGNNSGSATTTGDNILGMALIIIHAILRLPGANESWLELVDCALFGDDAVAGDSLPVSDEVLRKTIEDTFALYGVTLDPFVISEDLEDMEFLGFKFSYQSGQWIPKYPASTISVTVLSNYHNMDIDGEVGKLYSALIMSAGNGEEYFNSLSNVLNQILYKVDTTLTRELRKHGTPTYHEVIQWYIGGESELLKQGNFNFLQPVFLEAGRNKTSSMAEMREIQQAEKRIKTLSEKVGASHEGRIWMEEILDPFTDTPKRCVGFPDLICGNSIVQVVKQSFDFSITSGTSENVHIFMDNIDENHLVEARTMTPAPTVPLSNTFIIDATTPTSYRRGGVVVRSATDLTLPLTTTTTTTHGGGLPTTYYANGRTRVLGKAFEVHNTTPELYKGGSVTVYRDSTTDAFYPSGVGNLISSTNTDYSTSYPMYPGARVPETLADVMRIPGAQQWEAKEGCYCVSMMNRQTNNPYDDTRAILKCRDSSTDSSLYAFISKASGGGLAADPYLTQSLTPSPFFVSGAFFAALPKETTLTINTVHIIERFVDQSNLDLIVLASPSPYYDPVAMELYSRVAHRMPAGVPVGYNDLGEWIKEIASTLQEFGVPGMPIVKGVVNGIQALDRAVGKPPQRQESKTKRDEKDIDKLVKRLEAAEERARISEEKLSRYNPSQLKSIPKPTVHPQVTTGLKVSSPKPIQRKVVGNAKGKTKK